MRRTFLIAASVLSLCSTPALADTRKAAQQWEAAYLTLSAVDAAQTIYALDSGRAEEANPLFGKHPSTAKIIGVKLAVGALHYGIFRYALDRDPKAAMRFAQISAGLQGGVVMLNFRFVF